MERKISLAEMDAKLDRILSAVERLRGGAIEQEYMTAQETADFLRFDVKTIYNKVYTGQLHAYKPGGKLLRFKRSELEQWMEARR